MNNEKNLIKDFEKKPKQEKYKEIDLSSSFLFLNNYNPKITSPKEKEGYSLTDIRKIALLKYITYPKIGRAMGFGSKRAWHILHGLYLPKNPDIIRRVANALNIDPLVLTQIFEEERRKEKDE